MSAASAAATHYDWVDASRETVRTGKHTASPTAAAVIGTPAPASRDDEILDLSGLLRCRWC